MCYIIISGGGLVWFLLTLIADMLILVTIVTPKWLIGPNIEIDLAQISNLTTYRYPSVGIYTRCKTIKFGTYSYQCGPFDFDGFATDSQVYPNEWKASMFFASLAFFVLSITIVLILVTFCRQAVCGKSIHNIVSCAQVFSGICIMISIFLHLFGWGAKRVINLCGPEAEPFYPAMCNLGYSFYCAVSSVFTCFVCAAMSVKAESSNLRPKVKKRVEDGERLICIP